jgi:phage gp36-like protein
VRGQLTMTYATVQDMVDRFGETEMIRLSRPEDRDATTVLAAKVELAIADACGQIDDYLRGRYRVPVATPEKSIVRATCVLARYDLAKGERTDPTEPMRLDRKEVIAWLDGIAAGRINIDAPPAGELGSTGARISDRTNVFDHQRLRG